MNARERAAKRYENFHVDGKHYRVDRVLQVEAPDTPEVGWLLGPLVAVVYLRGGKAYEHEFGRPRPLLFSDPDGRGLYIAGGRFNVGPRGIEG